MVLNRLARNVPEAITAAVAAVCLLMTTLSLLYPKVIDWRSIQTGVSIALVACAVALWFEKLRGHGRLKFAFAIVLGVGVNCLALTSLWLINHARESGLYAVLSSFGCFMVLIGFVGAWCEPMDGDRMNPARRR